MHRYTSLRSKWTPTVKARQGVNSSLPAHTMEAKCDNFGKYWKASNRAPCAVAHDRDSFPTATVPEVRRASHSFASQTAKSLDGLHPRHLAMLRDERLATLAACSDAWKAAGLSPTQLWWMLLRQLEKPKGGYRPVLMCAGPIRGWEHLRMPQLEPFAKSSDKPHRDMGKGRSPEDAVWALAMKVKCAIANSQTEASCLWDGQKYYESFVLESLYRKGHACRHSAS